MAAQKLRCRVGRVLAHGERVYSVVLHPERAVPRFRAGQFLHLALDSYDPSGFWPDSRAFSIASSPAERTAIRITYSVQGPFTHRMEQELIEERQVWIKLPYGEFVVDVTRDAVLFAGGTGITAFTAFLDDLSESVQSVTVAYGARSEPLLIYRDVVDRFAHRISSAQVIYFAERASASAANGVAVGPISVSTVWPRVKRPFEAKYYLSGPPPMLRHIGDALRARNVRPEAIYIDAWE